MGTTMMLNAVRKNTASYTQNDYLYALRARELQVTLSQPTTKDFIHTVNSNMIPNCLVTKVNINTVELIFGLDLGSIKSKTTRRKPPHVNSNFTPVPEVILECYAHLALSIDMMFVNQLPMLVTI